MGAKTVASNSGERKSLLLSASRWYEVTAGEALTLFQSKVGVGSVVIRPLAGFVGSVGAVGRAAQACCGEIVNPNNKAEETTDPIRMSDDTKEVKILFTLR